MQAMGLTLINNTNLSYFPNEQKAAVFKLQGMLFEVMDDSEQAAQLYFTSLHIKEDAQAWLMWGKLCANKAERCGNDIIKARGLGEQSKNMVRASTVVSAHRGLAWPGPAALQRASQPLGQHDKSWACGGSGGGAAEVCSA
jgi:hypothetical protein